VAALSGHPAAEPKRRFSSAASGPRSTRTGAIGTLRLKQLE
jgi:hypothetical protein